jgi:hypothetical protein
MTDTQPPRPKKATETASAAAVISRARTAAARTMTRRAALAGGGGVGLAVRCQMMTAKGTAVSGSGYSLHLGAMMRRGVGWQPG